MIFKGYVRCDEKIGPCSARNSVDEGFGVLQFVGAVGFGVEVDQYLCGEEWLDVVNFGRDSVGAKPACQQ